jgi:hypothetical protein
MQREVQSLLMADAEAAGKFMATADEATSADLLGSSRALFGRILQKMLVSNCR